MKRNLFFIIIMGIVILSACAKPTEPPPTDPPPTNTPTEPPPTATEVPPTETPVPTETLVPTETPIPTETLIPTPTPYDGPARIVFSSNRGEDPAKLGIYYINTETLEITHVDTGFDVNFLPKWSPDGNTILFSIPGIWNLYTINADGSELTQITDFRSNNADWSPDGSKIVFQSDHRNEPEDTPDIYVMDINGENLVEILDDPDIIDISPRWSADGSKIWYLSAKPGWLEIFMMNADGSDPVQVTESGTSIISAALSPDDSRIAFVYPQGGQSTDMYIIDADGSVQSVVRLTKDPARDESPSWSPDGSKIVFNSDRGGNTDLWIINADGSEPVQLTDDHFADLFPDWSP